MALAPTNWNSWSTGDVVTQAKIQAMQDQSINKETTTTRDALSVDSGSEGAVIYNTTTSSIEIYDGSAWGGGYVTAKRFIVAAGGRIHMGPSGSPATETGQIRLVDGEITIGTDSVARMVVDIESGGVTVDGLTVNGALTQDTSWAYLGSFNSSGVYPSAGTALAVGWNASGGGRDISFWNTDTANTSGSSFNFKQLTGASAETTHFTIRADGTVGIGTVNPDQNLHIEGGSNVGIQITSTDSDDCRVRFGDAASTNVGMIKYDHATDQMEFTVGSSIVSRISSSALMTGGTTQPGTDAILYAEGGTTFSAYNPTTTTTAVILKAYSDVGGTESLKFDVRADGDTTIAGALSKSSGTFDIEHPVRDGWRLRHSFIEGPQADLIYRGQVVLDSGGTASVDLDDAAGMTSGTWAALCRDPWSIASCPNGEPITWQQTGSMLTVTGEPGSVAMWIVIAERQDDHMMGSSIADDDGRIVVEYQRPADTEVV